MLPVSLKQRSQQVFKLGRLQMVHRVPVIAGDQISISIQTALAFERLRRPFSLDAYTEMYAFYCPYRWTYGEALITALTTGYDNTTAYATTKAFTINSDFPSMMLREQATYPLHLWSDMSSIVDWYFKNPHEAQWDSDNYPDTYDDRDFGPLMWNMPAWGIRSNFSDDHASGAIAANTDPLALAKIVDDAKDAQMRLWVAVRPKEVHDATWAGGKIPSEVVKKPVLLMHEASDGSDKTMRATSGPGFGEEIGIASGGVKGQVPEFMVGEHGTIYFVVLSRLAPTFTHAYYNQLDHMTFFSDDKYLLAHPVSQEERPRGVTLDSLFSDTTSSTVIGFVPHHAHYGQSGPDWFHPRFYELDKGWTPRPTPSSKTGIRRCSNWDDIFESQHYGHGWMDTLIQVNAMRNIGKDATSIFSGLQT